MGIKGFKKLRERYNVEPITNDISILEGCKICVDIEQYFYIYSYRILKNKIQEIKSTWINMVENSNYPYDVLYTKRFSKIHNK